MKTCLGCVHSHITKDLEFILASDSQGAPSGKCYINLDLYWCDKPEVEDDDFQVLSFGRPDKWEVEHWFPQLASVCSDFVQNAVRGT